MQVHYIMFALQVYSFALQDLIQSLKPLYFSIYIYKPIYDIVLIKTRSLQDTIPTFVYYQITAQTKFFDH